MKALFFDGTLRFIEAYPLPMPGRGEARIRVLMAGLCQTDAEIMKGYLSFQGIMGHEFVGIVEDCEDRDWIGKRVVGEINCSCGTCPTCLAGLKRHCPFRTVLGISGRNGAFAEYLVLPSENLHTVPDTVSDRAAVFVEPLAAAYRLLEEVHITSSDNVIILGDGRLGILVAQVLQNTGCDLILLGKHPWKLEIARAMGIRTALAESYDGDRGGFVVECSGSPQGLSAALKLLRPMGTLILKSTYRQSGPADLATLVINEINLIGSRCGPFGPAIEALVDGSVSVEPLVTAVLSLRQGEEAFRLAASGTSLKILFDIAGDASKTG